MKYTDLTSMPLVLTIPDVADTLQIGRSAAYALARSGELFSIRVGTQIRVPRSALIAYIKGGTEIE